MSVIAIDIGNTRLGVGLFAEGAVSEPAQRITHDEIADRLDDLLRGLWAPSHKTAGDAAETAAPEAIVIASVAPQLTPTVAQTVERICGQRPKIIGKDLPIPMQTALTDESTLGVDRLLAALCTYVNTQSAAVMIHCGSALVVDAVSDDGVFLGGSIGPGLQMCARALHENTAQLPLATLDEPTEAFGRNTLEALGMGIYAATRGAIRELVERYAEKLGHWPHVVGTGGDAQRLLPAMGIVDSLIPDLVLQGAALVWEHHAMAES